MNNLILPIPPLKKIYIQKSVIKTIIVRNIKKNIKKFDEYKNTKIIIIESIKVLLQSEEYINDKENKDILAVLEHKGKFIHNCPGSDGVLCCHYFIINTGINCSYDCDYCFLQNYTNISFLTIFANTDDLFNELESKIKRIKNTHLRIGTGEFTDSLSLDHLTQYSEILISYFADKKNSTLELKTKSSNIKNLLNVKNKGNTVISWSLNTEYNIKKIEKHTASLKNRIKAANIIAQSGYYIAFHFDPLIYYKNWKNEYSSLIRELFTNIPTNKIRWISLGTFRYSSGFKEIIKLKKINETITKEEMFLSSDNKFRYLSLIRKEMYIFIKALIHQINPDIFVYLCMETKEMWKKVFSEEIRSPKILDEKFEKRRKELL